VLDGDGLSRGPTFRVARLTVVARRWRGRVERWVADVASGVCLRGGEERGTRLEGRELADGESKADGGGGG